jgi:subtilisin family serine protease
VSSISRRPFATIGLALSVILSGLAGATSAAAAGERPPFGLAPAGLDAPIRAFGWPADAPPNDPLFTVQTDLAPIGVASAWTRTTGASSVVVAVLDTGIDAANAEFAGRLVPGYNALTGLADSPGDFGPTDDDAGHGTHVSGTIAAAADNGTGVAGIAPNVSIMPVKVLDANGEGDFAAMRDGLTWAIAHGARIVTMSLGGALTADGIAYLQGTFDSAHAAGAIVVAAAGNDGAAINQYPCNFRHVICVGSTTNDGSAVSSFSNRTDGLALVAPGERIPSTLPGGGYGYGTGTSMATPHVTAAAALLRSLRPSLTPDETFTALTQTARPLTSGGHNPESGYGLVQVAAAVDAVMGAGAIPTPVASPAPSASPTPSPSPTISPSPTPAPAATPTPTPTIDPVPITPMVTASSPRNGQRSVSRSVHPFATFSVPVVGLSTRTVRMKDLSTGRWVRIRVAYVAASRRVVVTPASRLAANHSYRITVSSTVTALGGRSLVRPISFTFRTGYR